jgi:hypothetical protein
MNYQKSFKNNKKQTSACSMFVWAHKDSNHKRAISGKAVNIGKSRYKPIDMGLSALIHFS